MRIVSGIQPSSDALHIGNYFGAVRQWLDLQNNEDCFFFIADLHALTEPTNSDEFKRRVLSIAQDYLALGLDKSTLFLQSAVPQHTQLMWLLTTVTAMGDLERMTQFKDKSQRATKETGVNAGLFLYPVLMAAYILLYQAELVPGGDDQFQHLELAREIARRFNHKYGKNGFEFKIPEPLISTLGGRIMALNDPTKKMSKSLGPDSYIGIFEDAAQIEKKVARAVTDSGSEITYEPKTKPGLASLIEIFSMIEKDSPENIIKTYKNKKYSEFKKNLADKIFNYFKDTREKRMNIVQKGQEYTLDILNKGAEKARKIASETLREASEQIGILSI